MAKKPAERAFQKKVAELIRKANKLEDAEVKKVVRLLSAARKEVAASVASTEWQAYHLPQLKAAVERALEGFGQQYGVAMRDAQREFWEVGVDLVDLPLRAAGVAVAIPEIDMAALAVLQGFSSDLITGLSKDAIKKVNSELTLALMGQKSPFDAMEAIGRNLDDKSIFKNIKDRAEAITRTEGGRVLEAAGQARKESAAKVVPGLQKKWYYGHSPKMPRPKHMEAHGQIRDVDKPFNIAGEELMYPKDPAGSAKNTIRCG